MTFNTDSDSDTAWQWFPKNGSKSVIKKQTQKTEQDMKNTRPHNTDSITCLKQHKHKKNNKKKTYYWHLLWSRPTSFLFTAYQLDSVSAYDYVLAPGHLPEVLDACSVYSQTIKWDLQSSSFYYLFHCFCTEVQQSYPTHANLYQISHSIWPLFTVSPLKWVNELERLFLSTSTKQGGRNLNKERPRKKRERQRS